jgi:hypothetical protein
MPTFYDDNYGFWTDMNDPDMRDFYFQTQKQSKRKQCKGCGRMVKIKPEYAYCNSCADRIEQGWECG